MIFRSRRNRDGGEPGERVARFSTATLVIAILAAVAGGAGARSFSAPELRDLAEPAPGDSARVTIWVAFRPSDCKLPPELIRELNQLDQSMAVAVRGVLLESIEDPAEAQRLIHLLGIRFQVVTTDSERWRAAARADRYSDPMVIVFEGDRRLGTFSPRLMRSLRAYLPSAVTLGADP